MKPARELRITTNASSSVKEGHERILPSSAANKARTLSDSSLLVSSVVTGARRARKFRNPRRNSRWNLFFGIWFGCGPQAALRGAKALVVAVWLFHGTATLATDKPPSSPPKQVFRGQVVLVADALERRKIKASQDELKGQVTLETPDGELIPILPDWRGRAFYQDERLRNRTVELVGYRRPGLPYLFVLAVFTFDDKGRRQYTDYWCDICSIPMYELKPCDCCQETIRLRFQPQDLPDGLEPASAPTSRQP